METSDESSDDEELDRRDSHHSSRTLLEIEEERRYYNDSHLEVDYQKSKEYEIYRNLKQKYRKREMELFQDKLPELERKLKYPSEEHDEILIGDVSPRYLFVNDVETEVDIYEPLRKKIKGTFY